MKKILISIDEDKWGLLYETLIMDAESSTFDRELRKEISDALHNIDLTGIQVPDEDDLKDVINYILFDRQEKLEYIDHLLDVHASNEEFDDYGKQKIDGEYLIEKYHEIECDSVYAKALFIQKYLDILEYNNKAVEK